jgi:anthranilate synthase component 1
MLEVRPAPSDFRETAEKANLVPVWCEILCDADTPVGAYAKLRGLGETAFLLESVVGGDRWARYSFIGVGHRARLQGTWRQGALEVSFEAGPGFSSDPAIVAGAAGLDAVDAVLRHYRADPVEGLPRFWGGLVGVCGHDLVRALEKLPEPQHGRASDLPAFELLLTDTVVIFDTLSQRVRLVATACPGEDGGVEESYAKARSRLDRIAAALRGPTNLPGLVLAEDVPIEPTLAAPWEASSYRQAVTAAKHHIRDGDVFQIVLSQRFDEPRAGLDPLDVYRTLRVTNPAPYMYLLDLPSASLAGASPEVLVRVDRDDHRVTLRPIAGTRPRGETTARDLELERELLEDAKERAEHLMLIDLGRNDVGRVSRPGTVRVDESFVIERYSQVMHIVSEVSGELLPELSALDALRASFPAGTLSGAPKVRALELIDELEPAPRGWYGGAVGYLGYDGGADFAICIRSVVCTQDQLRLQAGAGIVYDSVPEREDEECHRKAKAVVRAIAMARAATKQAGS